MNFHLAKDGWIVVKFVLIVAIASYIIGSVSRYFYVVTAVAVVFLVFTMYFFRNPDRAVVKNAGVLYSPADGEVFETSVAGGKAVVKIFMSVLNVHVQRAPMDGKVTAVEHKAGKFLHAKNPLSDEQNEQQIISIKGAAFDIKVKQIAGIIARRTVSWVKPGDSVSQGGLIGMIRFGSQVDVIMPDSVAIRVKKGDRVSAGLSVMGELKK